jgi:hypothetical protein
MPVYEEEPVVRRRVVREPAVERRVVEEPVVQPRVVRDADPDDGLTSYALVKYGFILVMTLIILYFIANYLLPLIR